MRFPASVVLMQLLQYLGRPLKSDDVIELITDHEMEIIYNIDTLHENIADSYSARSVSGGFELLFDEGQILNTVFCFLTSINGAGTIDPSKIGAPLYSTIEEARLGAQSLAASFEMRENVKVPLLRQQVSWAKLGFHDHWRHYQYSSHGLERVSLTFRASSD